jgi:hypothetical protein
MFFGTHCRKFCRACGEQRKRTGGLAIRRGRPQEFDLSPAQIEATFNEALAQIRRERKHEADVSTSQAWKYEEPGR